MQDSLNSYTNNQGKFYPKSYKLTKYQQGFKIKIQPTHWDSIGSSWWKDKQYV